MLFTDRLQRLLQLCSFASLVTLGCTYSYTTSAEEFYIKGDWAVEIAQEILEKERTVQMLGSQHNDHHHKYDDKFSLVEQTTNSAWWSMRILLARIGLDFNELDLLDNNKDGIHLAFTSKIVCNYQGAKEVQVDTAGQKLTTKGTFEKALGFRGSQFVTEFDWKVQESYEVYICGDPTNCNDQVAKKRLHGRDSSLTVSTRAKIPPVKGSRNDFLSLNMTWWATQMKDSVKGFSIDRSRQSCRTPLNNQDVTEALQFHKKMNDFCAKISAFFSSSIYKPPGRVGPRWPSQLSDPLPSVMPFFENSTLLSAETLDRFRKREMAELDHRLESAAEMFTQDDMEGLVSVDEVKLGVLLRTIQAYIRDHMASVFRVEEMTRKQLVQAVGKTIQPQDFHQYMAFHSTKLFANDFAPIPFSHAVRQPHEYPVGIASVEEDGVDGTQPIQTFTRRINGQSMPPIQMALDASTSVELTGERFLSGWIRYEFDSTSIDYRKKSSKLVARARQFSSYILLIGTMSGRNTFDPKHAIILQNKDEVIIPLLTEVIPSAKEFKDAIESLSPEQQAFARAYRSMQLKSSVFAVLTIQLKPQLELLLNLPKGSLSKEIKLTEDLMSLFVDYQIPSNLLSYDGLPDGNASPSERVEAVKKAVEQVLQIIADAKKQELKEREQKYRYEARSPRPSNAPSGSPPDETPTPFSTEAPSKLIKEVGRGKVPALEPTGASTPKLEKEVGRDKVPSPKQMDGASSSSTASKHYQAPEKLVNVEAEEGGKSVDFTSIPQQLDSMLERYDSESYLHSTIIKPATAGWTMKRQASILSSTVSDVLQASAIAAESNKAADLLDAISRSGTLPITSSELHVLVGMTHCFDHSLIETVVHDNINPIAKAEKSSLLVGMTIFGRANAQDLIGTRGTGGAGDLKRLSSSFPGLFGNETEGGVGLVDGEDGDDAVEEVSRLGE